MIYHSHSNKIPFQISQLRMHVPKKNAPPGDPLSILNCDWRVAAGKQSDYVGLNTVRNALKNILYIILIGQ